MTSAWVVLLAVVAYMVVLAGISYVVRRSSRTSEGLANGGRVFPAVLIGFLLMSEFIGTSATLGTAQEAYDVGISAAWNVVALAIGFVLFSLFVARRYKALGENTISGALASTYGEGVRTATSVIMTCALLIVAVAIYASGGAMLSSLLGIDRDLAIVVVGVLATVYVVIGGMRSVVYTNVLHAVLKLAAVGLLAVIGVTRVGGLGELRAALPAENFSVDGVGWGQIFAWLIAGVGAIFATQYVVQAVTTVADPGRAQRAGFYSALMLVPFGILAAVVGMVAAALYPGIDSLDALPTLAVDVHPLVTAIVMCGLVGAILGSIAALIIGSATLLLKDFYRPFFNRDGDDRKDVVFLRVATFGAGVVPIALALFASDVLAVTFLAKSLRAALAVLIVLMFYRPTYGSSRGAVVSILAALVATTGWFLAGDPFGIDNAYVAVACPLVIMTVVHLLGKRRGTPQEPLVKEQTA
ncbi:sodium:solute symporter family protein [Pseudonocardia kunmingensis]|uniref:SSS family solute:Na+ symporter n=1 Tax=Pseudonocardia kunmingensis TaxID=630975 RepID=A0A543DVQ7_9PSEU|nr:sodium:solute symporter family protein [Pseudonocardia kunmingensis]TQM13418.1 SSS family solute:Na+ symporter [Pseudonocardia kunmingensis]